MVLSSVGEHSCWTVVGGGSPGGHRSGRRTGYTKMVGALSRVPFFHLFWRTKGKGGVINNEPSAQK